MRIRNPHWIGAAFCALSLASFGLAQNFIPDFEFKGSSLNGSQKLGSAEWRADGGTIVALPKESGGWLLLNKSYQDVNLSASFECSGKCAAGLLLRAEKTAEGTKGIFISLSSEDPGTAYEVMLDSSGHEVNRMKLPASRRPMIRNSNMADHMGDEPVPGFSKLAEPPPPPSAQGETSAQSARRGRAPELSASGWNTVQAILDMDLLTVSINGRRGGMPVITYDRMMGFGPVGLYAAGAGEVRFKDLALKDLNVKVEPKETVSKNFRMQRLSDFYYGWCAAVADINHDGINDIVAGPFYFLGPDYTERREFTAARTYNPATQFAQSMVTFAYDVTGDGWDDIIVVDQRPIWLYVNPKGEPRRWDRYNIIPKASTEIELFKDIDGDGKPDILFGGDGVMAYAKPDPANPTAPWIIHPISEKGRINAHGMGVGDINGDGRMDVVNSSGWWEQPANNDQQPWPFHADSFGSGGAEMGIFDVNGDGRNDIVTALAAHGWGLAWFEQKRDAQGAISFVKHDIMGDFSTKNAGGVTFSELHAANFADIDGDGIPDIIIGKRHFSHLDSHLDPDPQGAAVLYWYRTTRNPKAEGGAEFVPELIHNRSGVGSHFETTDIDRDGRMDIVTSTNRGTFIFWGTLSSKK